MSKCDAKSLRELEHSIRQASLQGCLRSDSIQNFSETYLYIELKICRMRIKLD